MPTDHGSTTTDGSWQERWKVAQEAHTGREWARAAELWTELHRSLAPEGERADAGRRAAVAFRRAGDLDAACDLLASSLRLAPADPRLRSELAYLDTSLPTSTHDDYWARRMDLLYMQVSRQLALRIAGNARSVVDVGSLNTPVLEWLPGVPERISVDLMEPYRAVGVRSVVSDFLTWEPGRRFDVGLCFQVLEHVPDARSFAQRLLKLFDVAIVSVPYRWPEDKSKYHVHDPVDEAKMASWFDREPNWSSVVDELDGQQRWVAIYDRTSFETWRNVRPEPFRFRWSLRGADRVVGDLVAELSEGEGRGSASTAAQATGEANAQLVAELRRARKAAGDSRARLERLENRRSVRTALRAAALARPLVRAVRRD
jgi:hypothetical protein